MPAYGVQPVRCLAFRRRPDERGGYGWGPEAGWARSLRLCSFPRVLKVSGGDQKTFGECGKEIPAPQHKRTGQARIVCSRFSWGRIANYCVGERENRLRLGTWEHGRMVVHLPRPGRSLEEKHPPVRFFADFSPNSRIRRLQPPFCIRMFSVQGQWNRGAGTFYRRRAKAAETRLATFVLEATGFLRGKIL